MKKLLILGAAAALLAGCDGEPEVAVIEPEGQREADRDIIANRGEPIDANEDVDAVVMPPEETERR